MQDEYAHGVNCLMANEFEAASNVFQDLLQRDVHNPFITHNLGLSFEGMGKIDEAIEIYEHNIKTHPKHILSYLCLSNCCLYKSKLHKAICWLKKAEEQCEQCEELSVPAQVHILLSEACFLAGNPRQGCTKHAMALDAINQQNLTLTTHHVQLYTDYGNGSMPFYAWIEKSYISHGKRPTIELVEHLEHSEHSGIVRTLVLVQPQNAERVRKQVGEMTKEERDRLFIVAQSTIVERLLGHAIRVDARVVSSTPCQNSLETMAYVLDISNAVLHATNNTELHILLPDETDLLTETNFISVDASVQATNVCPMLLRGDQSTHSVYSLSSLK
jgi:tetratricopeptide (TPR) repeat protein